MHYLVPFHDFRDISTDLPVLCVFLYYELSLRSRYMLVDTPGSYCIDLLAESFL